MKNPENHEEISSFLQKHDIEQISTFEQIEKLFDFESIKQKKPVIHTKENTIVIFDNPDYNKAFLHEFFDRLILNRENISKVINIPDSFSVEQKTNMYADLQNKVNIILPRTKLLYCNSEMLNEKLFRDFFESVYNSFVNNQKVSNPDFEYPPFDFDCPPVLIIINPQVEAVFIDFEKLMPFNIESILSAYLTLLSAEKLNDAHEKQKQEAQRRYDEAKKQDDEAIIQMAQKSNFKA